MLHKKLIESVKHHEGKVLNEQGLHKTYLDIFGNATIGYGILCENLTITDELATKWLMEHLESAQDALGFIPEYQDLDAVRRDVLVELAYNLGLSGLLSFVKMFAAIRAHDFKEASVQLLDSKYSKQVGKRARTLARRLRTGTWDDNDSL